jgi:hypothetical protein
MHRPRRFSRRRRWTAAVLLALAASAPVARAAEGGLRISEVLAGTNGDSRVQFVELYRTNEAATAPHTLLFFDALGRETGAASVPAADGASRKILVATGLFAQLSGAPRPDVVMPPLIQAQSGKVCLAPVPAEPGIPPRRSCVSYGDFRGDLEGAGAPAPPLPILNARSLSRTRDSGQSRDFVLSKPSPTNSAGATFTMPVASLASQGEALFNHETFQGNGRTCASCHVRRDSFGLSEFHPNRDETEGPSGAS